MKYKVIPTVFAIRKEDFNDRLERIAKLSKEIQIDFMDGIFVSSKFIDFDIIPDLSKFKGHTFEAHMMTKDPGKYFLILKKKGFKKIIIHFESYFEKNKIVNLARKIKKEKISAFLAVNPETKVHDYLLLLKEFDGVMFMGVHPGKEHQTFIYDVLTHVKELRHYKKKIDIQIDGGVNAGNISYIKKAGVNIFNSGSYISESDNPKAALTKLKKEMKN